MGTKRVGLARTQALIEGLKRDLSIGKTRFKHSGDAPALTVTTAGNGACAISATSTDVAGELTFTNTWADGDTVLVTFDQAYGTAPKVILSNAATINSSGQSSVEIDTIAITTAGFTLTASGTCAGVISYLVVETA